jgi:hypothetical protein
MDYSVRMAQRGTENLRPLATWGCTASRSRLRSGGAPLGLATSTDVGAAVTEPPAANGSTLGTTSSAAEALATTICVATGAMAEGGGGYGGP